MCFWFGLEILRLVCKKNVFFKYWTVSILFDFYPLKKVARSPQELKKNSSFDILAPNFEEIFFNSYKGKMLYFGS